MIPILYESNETDFTTNGIARLRDCQSCVVTEERNGIYECDIEYPTNGANYDLIEIGRIIAVTHDDTGDIQPFDIVSYTKPIDGIVTFHCTHVSYRQSYMVARGTNINSLSAAFTLFSNAVPSNPFTYQTDKTSTGYMGCADGIPRSVREMLGGIEGSVLDTYGGEYEFDRFNVILHESRGIVRDFSVRYGVNMLEYNDEMDSQGAYSSCVPYWVNGDEIVVASRISADGSTPTGRGECVALDMTEKFENKPTTTQLRNAAKSYMNNNNTFLAGQTINVSFVRLQDMGEFADFQNLLTCQLCDTINVIFPDYGTNGNFKIVKTVWDVLESRFDSMELGALSVSLSEALGISNNVDRTANSFVNLAVTNDLTVGDEIIIGGHSSAIGSRQYRNATGNKASSTSWDDVSTSTVYADVDSGVWILHAMAEYPANSTGRRALRMKLSTDGGIVRSESNMNAVSGNVTRVNSFATIEISSSQTVTLQASQNSGSTLNSVHYYLEAVRII